MIFQLHFYIVKALTELVCSFKVKSEPQIFVVVAKVACQSPHNHFCYIMRFADSLEEKKRSPQITRKTQSVRRWKVQRINLSFPHCLKQTEDRAGSSTRFLSEVSKAAGIVEICIRDSSKQFNRTAALCVPKIFNFCCQVTVTLLLVWLQSSTTINILNFSKSTLPTNSLKKKTKSGTMVNLNSEHSQKKRTSGCVSSTLQSG